MNIYIVRVSTPSGGYVDSYFVSKGSAEGRVDQLKDSWKSASLNVNSYSPGWHAFVAKALIEDARVVDSAPAHAGKDS